jgi:hypothetical protein
MGKKRDQQICIRVPRELRAALSDVAIADGDRGLSGIIRKALVDFATKHITERASGADAGEAR